MLLEPEEIKKLRKELGITQIELADKAGIKQEHLSQIENRKKNISIPKLETITDILLDKENSLKKEIEQDIEEETRTFYIYHCSECGEKIERRDKEKLKKVAWLHLTNHS